MPFEEYRLNRNTPPERNATDSWFQRILLTSFSERTAAAIYGIAIDVLAFFAKIGVYISLPFKFLQLFRQSWRQNGK